MSLAGALEASSAHPLAAAIAATVSGAPAASGVVEEAGCGITGQVGDARVRVVTFDGSTPQGFRQMLMQWRARA